MLKLKEFDKKYQKYVNSLIEDAFYEHSNITTIERAAGIFLGIAKLICFSLKYVILFVTAPIWCIPFLIVKLRRNNENS